MDNIVTITGFKTEGGDTFENVPEHKIELIYEILNGTANFSDRGWIINTDKRYQKDKYIWVENKRDYLEWDNIKKLWIFKNKK